MNKPPWCNRLARSAVNRNVGGSSPPGDEVFIFPKGIGVQLTESQGKLYETNFKANKIVKYTILCHAE